MFGSQPRCGGKQWCFEIVSGVTPILLTLRPILVFLGVPPNIDAADRGCRWLRKRLRTTVVGTRIWKNRFQMFFSLQVHKKRAPFDKHEKLLSRNTGLKLWLFYKLLSRTPSENSWFCRSFVLIYGWRIWLRKNLLRLRHTCAHVCRSLRMETSCTSVVVTINMATNIFLSFDSKKSQFFPLCKSQDVIPCVPFIRLFGKVEK